VYFGPNNPPTLVCNQFETEFDPGILDPNTKYYWRIDEINDQGNRTTGDKWAFKTDFPQPGQAYNPFPANGATDVPRDVILSWTTGEYAEKHDVYVGTDSEDVNMATPRIDPAGVYIDRHDMNSCDLGQLQYGQTYYWRIDEINSEGKTRTGTVWSFLTVPLPPNKGRLCFTNQTGVWTDGVLIPISKVALDQYVDFTNSACSDGCSLQSKYKGTVEEVQEHTGTFVCYDILLESLNCITVAENHYFMTESGQWIALQDLKDGTRLQTAKGTIGIKSITKQPKPYMGKVYNLKIEGSDRYLVGEDAVIVRDY